MSDFDFDDVPRDIELVDAGELETLLGILRRQFATIVLIQLLDNALDAAEAKRVPPNITIDIQYTDSIMQLAVTDNGDGIPSSIITRILDLTMRTSNKLTLRAPSRGRHGYGLKLVFGIPAALSSHEPIIIETQSIRHSIRFWIDEYSNVRVTHTAKPIPAISGTHITITIPIEEQDLSPEWLIRAYALYNPHANIKISVSGLQRYHAYANNETGDFVPPTDTEVDVHSYEHVYHSTVKFPHPWRKFTLPKDRPSPHWYDISALKRLCITRNQAAQRENQPISLFEFIQLFRGLTDAKRARTVREEFPKNLTLSELARDDDTIARLLEVMQQAVGKPPSPDVLGYVGEDHIKFCFEAWFGTRRLWYSREQGIINGIPYVFEVALAETEPPGQFFTGINFSPTVEDPLSSTLLRSPKFMAMGLKWFFQESNIPLKELALSVHIICPMITFQERSKNKLLLPDKAVELAATALWSVVTKYRASLRVDHKPVNEKGLVFQYILASYVEHSDNEQIPLSVRDLFYALRPVVNPLLPVNQELNFGYFANTLVPEYQKRHRHLPALFYKPRGVLIEPHTGNEIPLGTREVEDYEFPLLVYDKILYIEKAGFYESLKAVQLSERYDIAIITAEGYANEAIRTLFQRASSQYQYKLFVLHDADPDGYNIARTLQEETRRMPGYSVEVIDIGLTVAEALEMNLQSEEFTRKRGIPKGLKLNKLEREFFAPSVDLSGKHVMGRRIELNAIPVRERAAYIERKLQEHGCITKVIPETDQLGSHASVLYHNVIAQYITEILTRLIQSDHLKQEILTQLPLEVSSEQILEWINQGLAEDRTRSWRDVLTKKLREFIEDTLTRVINDIIRKHLRAILDTLSGED